MSQETLYRDVEIIIPINNWPDRHYMYALNGSSDAAIYEQAIKVGEDIVRKFNIRRDKNKPIRVVFYDQEENIVSYWVNKVEKKLKDMFEDKNDEEGSPQEEPKLTAEEKLAQKTKDQLDSRTPL